jgi:hypothetical protein
MPYQLIYASRLADGLPDSSVDGIAARAQTRNGKNDITGFLAYRDRWFLQLLEGDATRVMTLFDKIRGDTRHTDVTMLGFTPIAKRSFGRWRMGFVSLGRDLATLSTYLRDGVFEPKKLAPPAAFALLHHLATWDGGSPLEVSAPPIGSPRPPGGGPSRGPA